MKPLLYLAAGAIGGAFLALLHRSAILRAIGHLFAMIVTALNLHDAPTRWDERK